VYLHLPSDPVASLVICSPLAGEGDSNYRREILLARTLAARGVAVLRHHYLGTGNSDGSPSDLTFASMLDDSLYAAELLAERSARAPLLLGTRLASYVAAEAASRSGAPGVVLWHPPSSGAGYFRQVGRMRRVNKLAQQAGRSVEDTRSIEEELAIDGRTELAGYEIHAALYDSICDLRLAQFDLPSGSGALIVEFGRTEPSPWLHDQAAAWDRSGASCRLAMIPEREIWWFANDLDVEENRQLTRQAVDITEGWIASVTASDTEGVA